jgi:hypothetical protein
MSVEVNCNCEIEETGVTVCYPPQNSPGGSGITGVGSVDYLTKIVTLVGADGTAIVTVGNSLAYESGGNFWVDAGFSGGSGTQLLIGTAAGGIATIDGINIGQVATGSSNAIIQASIGSSAISSVEVNQQDILVLSPNITDETYAYFQNDGAGRFTLRSGPAPSAGGITSLNGLTGATQTFTNDTNVTIVSTGTAHAITWSGTLADGRIASAATWNAKESALTFSTGLTRSTNTITNNLLTGLAGGQTIISGTAAGDKLIIQATSNATHTAAKNLIKLKKNSSSDAATSVLLTIGDGQGLNNDEVSIYTGVNTGTSGYLLRAGATFAYFNASSSLRLQIGAADLIQLSSSTATMVQGITISDAKNIVLNTTTGTKIGTGTTQKLAFWNKTPIVQPTTSITGASFVSGGGGTNLKTDDTFGGYTVAQLAAIIINSGLAA